jgi:SHS2 domain-containing protein
MPYEYLDHTADLGIRGIGATLEEAFGEGALAMLAAMADLGKIEGSRCIPIRCAAPDIPALFVEWLNEILYQRQVNDVLLRSACVARIEHSDAGWTLEGTVCGQALDLDRHETYAEIKAATFAGLDYHRDQDLYVIQCILDV